MPQTEVVLEVMRQDEIVPEDPGDLEDALNSPREATGDGVVEE